MNILSIRHHNWYIFSHKLFNLVFSSGIVRETWLNGIIRPIYKNKGDANDLDNYRAITLISCLRKLLTLIINGRLTFLSNEFKIISRCQSGFKKGYSTTDNIFIMHALISLYVSFGKKIILYIYRFPKGIRYCLMNWSFEKITKLWYQRKVLPNNLQYV